MLNKADERALIARAQTGDHGTFEQLLLAHCASLERHIARRLTASAFGTISVDDVLQETFVHAFRDIDGFQHRSGGSLLGWLKAIAEHRLLDALRRQKRLKRGGAFERLGSNRVGRRGSIVELATQLSADAQSPSHMAARDEAVDAMKIAVAALPDDQRKAVEFRYLAGHSIEETSAAMCRTSDAVRGLLHRAKQALRQSMQRSSKWFSKQ